MTSHSAATLRSRYVEQAASDLQENRRRQQELAESITVLKQEEALLLDILSLAERYETASDTLQLPAQSNDEPSPAPAKPEAKPHAKSRAKSEPQPEAETEAEAEAGAAVEPAVEPTVKPAAKPTAEPQATPTPAAKKKSKSPQPLLGQLLTHLLDGYEEPRHAKELREELLQKYPDRNPTPQVVRNTLESLVAKGRIRRHKQRRSVLYSLI